MDVVIEVCAGSMADVSKALAVHADRIELCAALELGGLTPSIALVESVLHASRAPVIVMLRPRAGGFCYDRHEFAVMLRDAERFLDLGVAGVAFGVLGRTGRIDLERAREIVELVKPRASVFHRAFDFVSDWQADLTSLIDMRCTRVLSSGGGATAAKGVDRLRKMVTVADNQIEIMAGGGITAANIRDIVCRSKCRQVHVGASSPASDGSLTGQGYIELSDADYLRGYNHKAVNHARLTGIVSAIRSDPR